MTEKGKCARGPFGPVFEHWSNYDSQAAAIAGIAAKIGCTAETLRRWVRQAETDSGLRDGVTSDERARIKALERENKELRQANEILRKASAYFAPPLGDASIGCLRGRADLPLPGR